MTVATHKPQGGARKGAGRKPGKRTIHVTFSLPLTTAALLSARGGNKSRFVNEAILQALGMARENGAGL